MELTSRSCAFGLLVFAAVASAYGVCEYGPDTCKMGFVWREAFPGDHVCVTGATRDQAANDNALAASRRSPNGGPYGPDTCKMGYVWREASPTDHVCVPGNTRTQTALDNGQAAARRDPLCADNTAPGFLEIRVRFFRVTDGLQVGDTVVPPAGITISPVARDRRFAIIASAGDSQSGVSGITASGSESWTCSPPPPLGGAATNQNGATMPTSDEEKNGTSAAGTPQLRNATFTIDPFASNPLRLVCPAAQDSGPLTVTTTVAARNGVGLTATSAPITVVYAGLLAPRTPAGGLCGNNVTGQTSPCVTGTTCSVKKSKVCDGWWIFQHCDYIQTTDMFCQ